MSQVKIIGIAGGSCSGKTTFSRKILEFFGDEVCQILYQDHYYFDQSSRFDKDGGSVNFDHPSALDFELLAYHVSLLKKGEAVEVPIYDFATHSRQQKTQYFEPKKLILLEGILILSQPNIVELLDDSFFIECNTEMRFDRRLRRDVAERGRTPEGVKEQFELQVEPMHQEFVEPSKNNACRVISQEEYLANWNRIIKSDIKIHV